MDELMEEMDKNTLSTLPSSFTWDTHNNVPTLCLQM